MLGLMYVGEGMGIGAWLIVIAFVIGEKACRTHGKKSRTKNGWIDW